MKHIIGWFFGLSVILVLIYLAGPQQLLTVVDQLGNPLFLFLLGLQLFTLSLQYYIWYSLLESSGSPLGYLTVAKISLISSFVESVTPSVKFGGEAVRTYLLEQQVKQGYKRVVGVLLAQKFISIVPLVILCLLVFTSGAFYYSVPRQFFYLVSFFIFSLLALFWAGRYFAAGYDEALSDKNDQSYSLVQQKLMIIKQFLIRAYQQALELLAPGQLFRLFTISFLIWLFYPLKLYIAARLLNIELNIFFIMLVTYAAYLVSMVPLFPGGLGSYESVVVMLFVLNGYSSSQGLGTVLVSRTVTFWFPLLISGFVTLLTMKQFWPVLKSRPSSSYS